MKTINKDLSNPSLERRDFMTLAALATATAMTPGVVFAESAKKTKNPLVVEKPEAIKALLSFAELTSVCALKGDICARHCDERLANGEAEFQTCAAAVRQMVVICDAATKLAAMNSVRMRDFLQTCIATCQACKDACEEHKAHWAHGMHLECKECAEQCQKVIAAGNKLKAALA